MAKEDDYKNRSVGLPITIFIVFLTICLMIPLIYTTNCDPSDSNVELKQPYDYTKPNYTNMTNGGCCYTCRSYYCTRCICFITS